MAELITNRNRARFRGSGGRFISTGGAFKVDTLSAGLANFTFKTREAIEDRAVEFADELVQYAKSNARWDDRTGDARAGLDGSVEATDTQTIVSLFHTVDYGVWLEVRWNGRYAIIIPTIEKKGSELLQRWNGIMGDILYYT